MFSIFLRLPGPSGRGLVHVRDSTIPSTPATPRAGSAARQNAPSDLAARQALNGGEPSRVAKRKTVVLRRREPGVLNGRPHADANLRAGSK